MKEDSRPLMVTIQCCTYNHENYIRQCLDGFVMQKTNFRFEAIIHDDASTDGTASIIREYAEKYPDIIKPIYETENQYSKRDGSIVKIMEEHTRGKYIAVCEGDDYWIDPGKLQKQVDFLEQNPEFVMVHTDYISVDFKGFVLEKSHRLWLDIPETEITNKLFKGYYIRTLTICYRNIHGLLNIYLPQEAFHGDKFLFYMLAQRGKVKFMNSITGGYRILSESASHSKDLSTYKKFSRSVYILDYFMADYLNISREVRDQLDYYWLHKALTSDNYEIARKISNPERLSNSVVKRIIYKNLGNKYFFSFMYYGIRMRFMIANTFLSCLNLFKFRKLRTYNIFV